MFLCGGAARFGCDTVRQHGAGMRTEQGLPYRVEKHDLGIKGQLGADREKCGACPWDVICYAIAIGATRGNADDETRSHHNIVGRLQGK